MPSNMKVKNVKTQDIRFPKSQDNIGTDAVHVQFVINLKLYLA